MRRTMRAATRAAEAKRSPVPAAQACRAKVSIRGALELHSRMYCQDVTAQPLAASLHSVTTQQIGRTRTIEVSSIQYKLTGAEVSERIEGRNAPVAKAARDAAET